MRRKYLLILVPLAVAFIVVGGLTLQDRRRTSRELDRLIAVLPAKPAARTPPARVMPEDRKVLPPARLIQLLAEVTAYGVDGNLGEMIFANALRKVFLDELEVRLKAGALDPADRSTLRELLRADLARTPDWSGALDEHRQAWLRWLARLREGDDFDESEVLGPSTVPDLPFRGRRVGDKSILLAWRAVELFFDRAQGVPLGFENYDAALDRCAAGTITPANDPVVAWFARYATRDLKTMREQLMEIREREQQLIESLE
jgi:hypothetical protein